MSNWTHVICDDCWAKEKPDHKPHRIKNIPFEDAKACCFCGQPTWAEIYIRRDAAQLRCKGEHHWETEDAPH